MSIPLSFLREGLSTAPGLSLGDVLTSRITEPTNRVSTLLDCLCTTSAPALYSPDSSRPPITHETIHSFVSQFSLPRSPARASSRPPLKPNDRVMLILPTGPENALALLSIAAYHTCAPLNASCTASELREDAVRLNAKAVVTTREVEERLELRQLQAELDCDVIYIEGRSSGPAGLFDMKVMDDDDYDPSAADYVLVGKSSPLHTLNDKSLVLHTSGTSGKKKVVPYTLRSLIVGTMAVVHSWDLQSSDVNMNMMPLFHVGGIVRNLLAPMMSGGSAIMCAGFDAIAFWTVASRLKATWYYAAPTIHHAILTSQPDDIDPARDMRLRMICNAAGGLLPSLAVDIRDRFQGAVVLPSYGMTECMPIASPPTTYRLERPGCSGIACGPHLSIRDPSNLERELPRGKTGAVSVRGIPTFEGYEVSSDPNVPLDTSAFTSEGWFDSGDMGYMDDDGYLFITGRSKEIINKGGEVISPFEVEEAIVSAAKDFVKTALAFAVDHDVLQEAIGIIIVPQPGQPRIGLNQLTDLLRDYLHPSKWPFLLVYMSDVPKNSAGKPLRIKLANRLDLGQMTDSIPVLRRHFEAKLGPNPGNLSEPIDCQLVSIDVKSIEVAISGLVGIEDAVVRSRHDGTLEAFVQVSPGLDFSAASVTAFLSSSLPGYALPDVHVMEGSLFRDSDGQCDFEALEKEVARLNSSMMSETALVIRDIVAELLNVEAIKITSQSDFFLLGGNSLLLGRLSYHIRKRTGVTIPVPSIFTNSTIEGIASLVESQQHSSASSITGTMLSDDDTLRNEDIEAFATAPRSHHRGQTHPLVMIIQSIPAIFFNPFKSGLTWSILLYTLSRLSLLISPSYWQRIGALLLSILISRIIVRTVAPIIGILVKWIVIGKYVPGRYPMWSTYYLRWWIVNQALIAGGKGIFKFHPSLEKLYYRLLGARIGKNVVIDPKTRLGEFDLITLEDGCRLDSALVRGFCVETNGHFRLGNVTIGQDAVINTYTQISPGATIPSGVVYGPHASSFESPSPPEYAQYNRSFIQQPHWLLKFLVAYPIFLVVNVIAYIPWFLCLWAMFDRTQLVHPGVPPMVSIIFWFSDPVRVLFHIVSRMVRNSVVPLIQLVLGIIVKRLLGLNTPCTASETTQLALLRRFINGNLLSQPKLKKAFGILGNHYEVVSIAYRLMGARIGKRIYWPGSGLYCLDPELLDIGDDVVFGSRSEFFTTDGYGTGRITIGKGAMIADRVVLFPETRVGSRTVMGSGALGRRGAIYENGSTWIGNSGGEAICLSKGSADKESPNDDTITPFGRAFYKRQASYFVTPYPLIFLTNFTMACFTAAYWAATPVAAAQILRTIHIHFPLLFRERHALFGIHLGVIVGCYLILSNIQNVLAVLWVIVTKWIVIGRRKAGKYEWDQSNYCQRWQLHLTLSQLARHGHGGSIMAALTGTTWMVLFYRLMGAKIGKDCALYPSGKPGLMTEPDLVELGDDVNIDDCSVVAHINSRGKFALNALKIGNGCAMRTGSRLLSGASMEDTSILCEHTLLTSGEIAESGGIYVGWPGSRMTRGVMKRQASTLSALMKA
ncbi:acetyl-CoA synthetase-like protein [Dendrothele bispora CBS 962.96]|uniref:Acetyl-CoA synthetase-like protein n=1 Tax=Dendrothele bispora (strain CBS 962.96) TaxID=1314807 RepID=A0A4S8M8A7_DENBC|nr:acetyl-CoA synthetase-like protein [Dendrothele bispora CBS 962.96]